MENESTEQETLPVTQADREAAASVADYTWPRTDHTHLRNGMGDQGYLVQAFARHRADHEPRAVEVGLREALRASLAKRSVGAMDPPWTAAFNAALDMVARDVAPFLAAQSPAPTKGEPRVFLDCDGVLADFDTYAETYFGMNPRDYEKRMGSAKFWQQLEAKGDFYRNLPLMPDAMALYDGVKHLHPTILTGCPRGDWAQGQKVAWAAEHFPGVPIITCRSADKRDYAKPGDVIIDDWPQHRHRWIEMGGVFIVHHDAASSLAALWAHYPSLAARPSTQPQADAGSADHSSTREG